MWALVDATGIVRNLIVWDGGRKYDPAPLSIRAYGDGVEIGLPYPGEPLVE